MDRAVRPIVKKRAIALIVNEPNEIYLDFLSKFVSYDIYIIIDSNKNMLEYQKKYKMMNLIQFDESLCKKFGFQNVNKIGINKQISGWDKALLFFSVIIPNMYKQVWFMEDDVFFLEENVLKQIDAEYPTTDLLANCDFKNVMIDIINNKNIETWLWSLIDIKINKPWYAGMMCATRMSMNVLQGIKWYATKYNTLFFLEALIPTITRYFVLSNFNPKELTTITYRREFDADIDKYRIYTHIFSSNKRH
jgi:hypothetical protein